MDERLTVKGPIADLPALAILGDRLAQSFWLADRIVVEPYAGIAYRALVVWPISWVQKEFHVQAPFSPNMLEEPQILGDLLVEQIMDAYRNKEVPYKDLA